MKVKSVNAFIKKLANGKEHQFIAIALDNGETVFVNTGLVVTQLITLRKLKKRRANSLSFHTIIIKGENL